MYIHIHVGYIFPTTVQKQISVRLNLGLLGIADVLLFEALTICTFSAGEAKLEP